MKTKRAILTAVLVLTLGAVITISRPANGSGPEDSLAPLKEIASEITDVVFLVVDTQRADHLPFHGAPREAAPFLAELADKSVVFERAYSSCSSTAPSMASVFTGRYPSRHRVISGLLAQTRMAGGPQEVQLNRLPARILTLPEYFSVAGFSTYGIADNLNISKKMGFAQGFDHLKTSRNEGAEKINNRIRNWPNEIGNKRFMYIHYMDPHAPYEMHGKLSPEVTDPRERSKEAYKSEVRFTDDHIRKLFEMKLWDENALIVFVSDHGEEFWEHGASGHGKSLHTEVIHVPFFIYHRSLEPFRVSEAVHTMDILPTLADIFRWKKDPEWQGQSLLKADSFDRPLFSELLRPIGHSRPAQESVIKDEYHLIVNSADNSIAGLYNLENDPAEGTNIASDHAGTTRELLQILELHRKVSPREGQQTNVEMSGAEVRHLKTLGYLQ